MILIKVGFRRVVQTGFESSQSVPDFRNNFGNVTAKDGRAVGEEGMADTGTNRDINFFNVWGVVGGQAISGSDGVVGNTVWVVAESSVSYVVDCVGVVGGSVEVDGVGVIGVGDGGDGGETTIPMNRAKIRKTSGTWCSV